MNAKIEKKKLLQPVMETFASFKRKKWESWKVKLKVHKKSN